MNIGDQITTAYIRKTKCPMHGVFCHSIGEPHFCRRRIERAIINWHQDRLARHEGYKVWLG